MRVLTTPRRLFETFGEAASSRVTGVEVSIDAYPSKPSDVARARLLGALQRTIWTDRDTRPEVLVRPGSVLDKLTALGEGRSSDLSRRCSHMDTVDHHTRRTAGEQPTRQLARSCSTAPAGLSAKRSRQP